MSSKIYLMNFRANWKEKPFDKFIKLLGKLELNKAIAKNALIAIKLHFGEMGNTGFIQPIWIRELVKYIKTIDAKPFLTDTNVLYLGSRTNSIDHLQTAFSNGFTYSCVNAPIIIADGLRGDEASIEIKIDKKHFKSVTISKIVHQSDYLISVAHFKGHSLTGFGGAIKNIGMGLADRKGKYKIHCETIPRIRKDKCQECLICSKQCLGQAIRVENKMPIIDPKKCMGCGKCIITCPNKVFDINWNSASQNVQERIVEFAYGALLNKKACFINFITNVTPDCDCASYSDFPIIPDIGIAVSFDPVALDQVCLDLVNQQIGFSNSALKTNFQSGENKIKDLYPEIDSLIQLKYAEELEMGSRQYEIEMV